MPPIALRPNPARCNWKFGDCLRERDVPDLNILVAPLVEQLDAANLLGHILGEDGVAGGALDLNFAVGHDCDVLGDDWGGGMGVVSGLVVVGSLQEVGR